MKIYFRELVNKAKIKKIKNRSETQAGTCLLRQAQRSLETFFFFLATSLESSLRI